MDDSNVSTGIIVSYLKGSFSNESTRIYVSHLTSRAHMVSSPNRVVHSDQSSNAKPFIVGDKGEHLKEGEEYRQ
jgi:hypothetical protein